MDASKMITELDEREVARVATAKQMIMEYPHYTDEQRAAWVDALDEALEVKKQAYLNAKIALEEGYERHSERKP